MQPETTELGSTVVRLLFYVSMTLVALQLAGMAMIQRIFASKTQKMMEQRLSEQTEELQKKVLAAVEHGTAAAHAAQQEANHANKKIKELRDDLNKRMEKAE